MSQATLYENAAPRSKRDTRIDVFRALALLTIFINHVPGTVYEFFTHKNLGFSDSAEAFVLISGMAVGLAYGARFTVGNRLFLLLKMWRRAFTLYSAHILTTLATLAIFCGAAVFLRHDSFLGQINIATLIKEPAKGFIGLFTLGHQLGYNNILPLYMVLLLAAPLMLSIAGKSLRLLLVLSGALYLFAGFYQIAPANYPTRGVWFLNPLSWQFLFAIGMAATIHVKRGGSLPKSPWLMVPAVAYLVLACIWVRFSLWGTNIRMGLPETLAGFNKTFVALPRLLHILALSYVIAALPAISNLARTSLYHPLALLGKYSLPVFVTGTVLSMVAQVLKQVNPGGVSYDTLLIATGIIVQFAVAYYLEWFHQGARSILRPQVEAVPAAPAAGEPVQLSESLPSAAIGASMPIAENLSVVKKGG